MNGKPLIFDWDEANLAHIAQHRVTREEAEQVFLGLPLDMELQIVGESNKRRAASANWRDG